jgi:predicted nucleotidyltransferase
VSRGQIDPTVDTSPIPPAIAAEIEARLGSLSRRHSVSIPLAIESGSRAWGFPSPDSDYDCRFIFVRSIDDYLSPWARRDVIEMPIEGDYDVNGWELGKALRLMLKGNAVILEWLQSPIIYDIDTGFRDEFLALAQRYSDRRTVGLHYLHLGEKQWNTFFGANREEGSVKKIFYVLRPAMALRWMALHPDHAVPPMHFPTLVEQSDLTRDVHDLIADLLKRKAATRELGTAPVPLALAGLIEKEFETAKDWLQTLPTSTFANAQEEVEAFFRGAVRRLAPKA